MLFLKLTDTNNKQKYINMDLVCQVKSDDRGSRLFFTASGGKGGDASLEHTRVRESGEQIRALMGQSLNKD